MKHCSRIDLTSQAIEYIRRYLTEGNTLATALLQTQALDQGYVFTWLPEGVDVTMAELFTTGGKLKGLPQTRRRLTSDHGSVILMERIPNTNPCLAKEIQDFLGGSAKGLVILEDLLSRPDDAHISSRDNRIVTYGDQVYYLLLPEDPAEAVVRAVEDSHSLSHFVCAMTSSDKSITELQNLQTLGEQEIMALAKRAEKIVVGAYDGESYLVWNKL